MLSLDDLERLGDRMVPGKQRRQIGEWILRADLGVTGRANSCWVKGCVDSNFGADLDSVERWYEQLMLPPRIQVFDGNEPIVAALIDRGYVARPGALMMTADEIDVAHTPGAKWRVSPTVPPGLAELVGDPGRVVECTRALGSVLAVTCEIDGLTVGGGVVVVDGHAAGIGMMHTHRLHRRTGIASAVLRRLAEEATLGRAHHFWLQVAPDNHSARRLYENVGFTSRHSYAYLESGV
jgi:ribosomal protein S18 acetylase RimI-like enzyme